MDMVEKESTTVRSISPAAGNSPGSALPIGATAKIPIIPGYGPGPRICDLLVSVLEVVRGKEMASRIQSLKIQVEPLKTGFENVAIRVKADYTRSGRDPREQSYKMTEGQFLASSSDGATEYKVSSVSKQSEEGLIGHTFSAGESRQGWLLCQLPKEEKKPLLIFRRENVDNVWGLWSDIFFKLY
jgi:hypothetical protein